MPDLDTLAARVEALEGPSAAERQLVIDAYNLIFPHELTLTEEEKGDDQTRYRRLLHRTEFTTHMNTDYNRASLDAAMMLAKDLGGQVTFFKDGTAKAFLWQPYPLAVEAKAATPALALTAAALRAHLKDPAHG